MTAVEPIATPDQQKRAAATSAAALVESGMHIGLGTGSTSTYFIEALAARAAAENLAIVCAATSIATEERATALGLRVEPLTHMLDLAIDGADEIEFATIHLIKGLGGALLREKQIAQSANRFFVIADETKLVSRLGERVKLPVEIVNFAIPRSLARLTDLGLVGNIRKNADDTTYLTDNGNLIADCLIGPDHEPIALGAALKTIAGVVETGLFTEGCAGAIIGFADNTTRHFEGDQFARLGVAPSIATLRQLNLPQPRRKPTIAVMGVSASGKSTIGAMLAACLGVPFTDGDDLHSAENRAKMHAGHPLTDNDRLPWLHRIAAELRSWQTTGSGGVIVSSLLTRRYRDLVRSGCTGLILINLSGAKDLLAARIAARHGHFMPPALLDSQFATLEPPGADETVITVQVDVPPIQIISTIMHRLANLA